MKRVRVIAVFVLAAVTGAQAVLAQGLGPQMDTAIQQMRSLPTVDQRTVSMMLASAAQGYLTAKDHAKAMSRITESIQIARENGLVSEVAFPMSIATRILDQSNDDSAAKNFLLAMLRLSKDDKAFRQQVLSQLGKYLAQSGDLVFSMQVLKQKLDATTLDSPGSVEEAEALLEFGRVCAQGQIYDLARESLNRGSELARKLNQKQLLSQFDQVRASTLFQMGEYKDSKLAYAGQFKSLRESDDTAGVDVAAQSLMHTMLCLGETAEAKAFGMNRLQEAKTGVNKGLYSGTIALAEFFSASDEELSGEQLATFRQQRTAKAIEWVQQAIAQKETGFPAGQRNYADMMTIQDHLRLAGFQLLGKDLEKASAAVDRAEKGVDALADSYTNAARLGAMSSDAGNIALSYYQSGISEIRQQILVRQQKFFEALVVAENSRGLAHAKLMEAKLGIDEEGVSGLTLQEIGKIANQQNKTIVFYALEHIFDESTRAVLPSSHPFRHPHDLYIWVVKPDGSLKFKAVGMKGPIEKLIALARQQINTRPKGAKPETVRPEEGTANSDAEQEPKDEFGALKLLHSILIQPIQDALPTDLESKLVFVPSGPLFNIPFAALSNQEGEPLIARHTLSVVPSIQILNLAAQQHSVNAKAGLENYLIVGNPEMPSYQSRPDKEPNQLSPLPGAEREAVVLGKMLKQEPLIGKSASETEITKQMVSAKVIHFATHGLLESQNVFQQAYLSAVALAPDADEDGFLTVRETMKMELRSDLVVLSACDTGLGKITGDGVIGLTRGHISAGVPTVVASLWPVNDNSAGFFMVNFYDVMEQGADKDTALRVAMLRTRQKFPRPKDWAAFSIYGLAQ
ncbi:MAG: CHAT domain-containing protein [Rubripirellula sp.]